MIKTLPDNAIRQAVYEAINGMEVDGIIIPCYDSIVNTSGNEPVPNTYTVLGSQISLVAKDNKCGYMWDSDIVVEVFNGAFGAGNNVSRVFSSNVLNAVRMFTAELELDPIHGLEIVTITQSFPNDIVITSKNQNVVRKFMSINLLIN